MDEGLFQKISTVTRRNHHLSFAVVIVVYVPYEWFLYNPTVCWVDFTKSAIVSKSGGEFLHITNKKSNNQNV